MSYRVDRGVVLFCFCLCLGSGCGRNDGPDLAQVTGRITIDGKPAQKLVIRFIPEAEGGSPSYGATDAEGNYRLMFTADANGAMLGKHRVEIEAVTPETGDDGMPFKDETIPVVPLRYREPGTLNGEVKEGNNRIDYVLESK